MTTERPTPPSHPIPQTLEIAGKLLALAATFCIALSVLFDWGYLSALDLKFSELPTSLSDHTRSALLWLPLAAFVFPVAVVANLIYDRIDQRDAAAARARGQDLSVYSATEQKQARRALMFITIVSLLIWLSFGYRATTFLFFSVIGFWILILVWMVPVNEENPRSSFFMRLGLSVPTIVAGSLYFAGYNSAREAIAPDQMLGMLTVRQATGAEAIKGNVVRAFERVVIVLDDRGKIVLLKPDDIVRIEKVSHVSTANGLLCEYWELACPTQRVRPK